MIWVAVAALVAALAALLIVSMGRGQIDDVRTELGRLRAALDDRTKELQRHLGDEITSIAATVSEAVKKLDLEKAQLRESRGDYEAATAQVQRRAHAHFAAANTTAVQAARRMTELDQYATSTLERQTADEDRPVILRGALYADQPSVHDLVPELVEAFLADLHAGVLYRHDDGPRGYRFYLRWPDSTRPAWEVLKSLLTSVQNAGPESAGPGSAGPGEQALRALLYALHAGGPSLTCIGPLVVARTKTRMWAGLAPADWRGLEDSQQAACSDGAEPGLMEQIRAQPVVDLTDWPSPHVRAQADGAAAEDG